MYGLLPFLGRYQRGRALTQAAGTAIVDLFPPMRGAMTHIAELVAVAGATAHNLYLLRPLNYTTVNGAAAAGQKVVNLTADPGVYSTNYQYPLLNAGPSGQVSNPLPTFQTADNPIAANDYLAFETPDGAFYFDKVASVATLAITMTNNLPAGGLASGARVWFFATSADVDPATGVGQVNFLTTVSSTNSLSAIVGAGNDIVSSLHPYDPILLYDANATAADTIQRFEGFYSKF